MKYHLHFQKKNCTTVQSLRDLCHANTGYFHGIVREEVYTSLIASFFQIFFGIGTIFSLHQLPCGSGSSSYRPDLHIVTMTGVTVVTLLINDFKILSHASAEIQTRISCIEV